MTTNSSRSDFRDYGIAWALVFSLTLHVLIMARLPGFHLQQLVKPVTLDVAIMPPPVPPPQPQSIPQQEPVKPQPVLKPQAKPRPIVLPKERSEPQPITSKPEPIPEPPPPAVISVAPKVEEPPSTFIAPEPAKPIAPSPQELDNDRALYGSLLTREIAKHKQYPKIAQMRGWQGTTMVALQIDNNGNLLSSSISISSGFEALDKQAVEMVKKASPLPLPPESLRNKQFSILVPVTFRLE